MVESEKAARQRKEDKEAKSRARGGRHSSNSRASSSGNSRDKSRRDQDRDREAKRRAKRSNGGGEEVKPGVSYEKSSKSSGSGSSSRKVKRDEEDRAAKRQARGLGGSGGGSQRSRRNDEDRAAKNRARGGGSRSNRPGVSSVSTGDGLEDRSRLKQSSGSRRSVEGQRPGASSSRRADHRKNREHGRSGSNRSISSHPAAEPDEKAAGEGDPVEAVAIDEEAQENERVRALEEQNRALADRVDQIANREKEAEATRVAAEEARIRKEKQKKRRITCIGILFVLAVGGGVAAYFLTQQKTDNPVATPVRPLDEDTAAPMVPPVSGTQAPATPDISEGPPSSPDAFAPPTSEDCARIRSGEAIKGQEDFITSQYQLDFDLTINDPNLSTVEWVPLFEDGIDKVLIPALAGCDSLEVQSDITYVIADGNSSIDPIQDVTDGCQIKAEGCNNVKVPLNLFLKGQVGEVELGTLIEDVLQKLSDMESSDTRQLESKNGEQPHHRKLLVKFLGLDPDIFKNVNYRSKGNVDPPPLEEPTLGPIVAPTAPVNEPTGASTPTPSEPQSWVPTNLPSSRPTMAPVSGPTPPPTKAPTESPTKTPTKTPTQTPTKAPTPPPTKTPTKAPTSAPVAGPTLPPTKGPTPSPTPPPRTPQPTVQASGSPTQFQSTVPSSAPPPTPQPTVQASGSPTQFLSAAPSSTPPPTPQPTVQASGSPTQFPSAAPSSTPPPTTPLENGSACIASSECQSGICVDQICSECESDSGCAAGERCVLGILGGVVYPNRNVPNNNDWGTLTLTETECYEWCRDEPECKTADYFNGSCYPSQSGYELSTSNGDFNMWVKVGGVVYPGRCIPGANDWGILPGMTQTECHEWCLNESLCITADYGGTNNDCYPSKSGYEESTDGYSDCNMWVKDNTDTTAYLCRPQ